MRTTNLLAFVAVTVACSGLAFWAGCGSDEEATPTDGDGGTTSSSGTGSSGTTSSSGTASSSGSSGNPDGGDGGAGDGSVGNADGGIDPADAGPGGDTTKISCGTATCALPAQTCCVAEVPGPGNRAFSCAALGGDGGCARLGGGDVTSLKCSSGANCPANMVCCVDSVNNGASSECRATCGNNEAQLCDKNAADAGCPQQDPCESNNIGDWGLPNTYATCGGQGPN